MSLSIVPFYSLKPHLPFRYKTKWYIGFGDTKQKETLSYCVSSITLPKVEIENNLGFSYFGDSFISMPTFSPGKRHLNIVFEETDDMLVSRLLDGLIERSYSKTPYYITIEITEFNEHFTKGITKGYVCHLSTYEEPQFKRDGQAQAITINASFIVDSIINAFTETQAITGTKNTRDNTEYNAPIPNLTVDIQTEEFRFGDLNVPVDHTPFDSSVLSKIYTDKSGRNEVYDSLHEDFKKSGVIHEGMTPAQKIQTTQKWMKENNYLSDKSQGLCATGNSVIHALAFDVNDYNTMGRKRNGKDWDGSSYYSKHTKNLKQADVQKKIDSMKNGDTLTITIDRGTEAGHVLTYSKTETGQILVTSDFDQGKYWQTYNPDVLKDSTFTIWEGVK